MSIKVKVRQGGHSGASTTDFTSRIRLFDGQTPVVISAEAFGQGTGTQGSFVIVDEDGDIYTEGSEQINQHNVVQVTEDASGDELHMGWGRINRSEAGRGPGTKQQAGREWSVTWNDQNSEVHLLALREDWPRPVETATERFIAAIEAFCQTDPRLTTDIVADRTHFVKPHPVDGEVLMEAHTYEMATQLTEILRECAETEGQDWGIVFHDSGGATHRCAQWCEEDDFSFNQCTLSISDDPDEVDGDTVFEPWWKQGSAILKGGGDPVLSTAITTYGDQRAHVLVESAAVIEKHDYAAEEMQDATTTTEAGATSRAPHLLAGRSREDVTHQVTILVPAAKAHLVRAGMAMDIKAAASRYEEAFGATATRRVAEVKREPYSPKLSGGERFYLLHLKLARPKKIARTRRRARPGPKAPTPPTEPTAGGVVRLYPSDVAAGSGHDADSTAAPNLAAADKDSAWEVDAAGMDAEMLYPAPENSVSDGGTSWAAVNAGARQALVYMGLRILGGDLLAIIQSGGTVHAQMRFKSRHGIGVNEAQQNNLAAMGVRVYRPGGGGSFIGTAMAVATAGSLKFAAQSTKVNRSFEGTLAAVPGAVAGDYVVVEIGTDHVGPVTGATGVTPSVTDSAASDLPENDTETANLNSWVEFRGASTGGSPGGPLPGEVVNPGDETIGDSSGTHALANHTHPHGLLSADGLFMHGALQLQPETTHSDSDPTVNDDAGHGFRPGWEWFNDDDGKAFLLADAADGAAVWYQVYPAPINLTVEEDGGIDVDNVDHIIFDGATVTNDGGGQVTVGVTGGGSDPLGWTTLVAAADEDVTNAQNQDHSVFQFAVVAGHIYRLDAVFIFAANNATADAEWRYLVTAGTVSGRGNWIGTNGSDTAAITGVATNAAANSSNVPVGVNVADLGWPISGRLTLTLRHNTTNGTFKIQFGNDNAASGRTTRMLKGSWLRYRDIT